MHLILVLKFRRWSCCKRLPRMTKQFMFIFMILKRLSTCSLQSMPQWLLKISLRVFLKGDQKNTMRLLLSSRLELILTLSMKLNLSYSPKKNGFRRISFLTQTCFKLMLHLFTISIIKPQLFVPLSINTLVVIIFNMNTQVDILDLMNHIPFNIILGTPYFCVLET